MSIFEELTMELWEIEARKAIKQALLEYSQSKIFEAICVIDVNTRVNITDVLTSIRAISGITIVTLMKASQRMTEFKARAALKIKFIPTELSTKQYLQKLRGQVLNIRPISDEAVTGQTVYSFRILSMKESKPV